MLVLRDLFDKLTNNLVIPLAVVLAFYHCYNECNSLLSCKQLHRLSFA